MKIFKTEKFVISASPEWENVISFIWFGYSTPEHGSQVFLYEDLKRAFGGMYADLILISHGTTGIEKLLTLTFLYILLQKEGHMAKSLLFFAPK